MGSVSPTGKSLRVYPRLPFPWFRSAKRHLPFAARVPTRALEIWKERPDLQRAFDLSKVRGREDLCRWYLRHAFAELALSPVENDVESLKCISGPFPRLRHHGFLPLTWLMHALVDRAPIDPVEALENRQGQDALLAWYFTSGLHQHGLEWLLTRSQAEVLTRDHPEYTGVPRLFVCIWQTTRTVRESYQGPSDPRFVAWCGSGADGRFPILWHPLIALAAEPARPPAHARPFGVNLFGHTRSRSGIGEDVRMAAKVLTEAGIPYVVRDMPTGPAMPEEEDHSEESGSYLPYAINLFCMTAESTAAAMMRIGRHVSREYYNVGYWPWELPEMPPAWRHMYDLVDEIWASSRYTRDAFVRSASVPVHLVPFSIGLEETTGLQRADFGLPDDQFLFGFAFDGLSGFARKAPMGPVQAFLKAFPDRQEKVGLVIKGLRTEGDPKWADLTNYVAGDPRVHFITTSMPRPELLDLWRAIDCFVSLHRCEGFGRNIAETMALGKPVVVTAHSGNMDFTVAETAALVPCDLRPVEQGEYPFGAGQLWADPDLDRAAAQMRKIADQRDWATWLGERARNFVLERYTVGAVHREWHQRLRAAYAPNATN